MGRRVRTERTREMQIEIYSAGCMTCQETIDMVRELAGHEHEVVIRDMQQADTADRARALGIRSLPAVVVNGALAGCCSGRGPDEKAIRMALP